MDSQGLDRRTTLGGMLGALTPKSAPAAPDDALDLYVGGQGGYASYRIPALVPTKSGALVAFCEGRRNSPSDAGDIDLLMRRSSDGGRTWGAAQVVHEEGGAAEITIGNPCPIVDGGTGAIHLLMSRNNQRVFYTRSTDDSKTFAAPVEITEALRAFPFPWTRIGTGPGHGVQLKSGRLLVPIWLNERIRFNYRSAVLYSDDGGKAWRTGGVVGAEVPDTNECMAVERSDGSVVLNMRAQGSKSRAVSISEDGGLTWSAPQKNEALVDPVCQASILRLDRGRQSYLVFANPASTKRENMTVRVSSDDGKTWPRSQSIWSGPAGYSDLAAAKDRIFCLHEAGETRYAERIRLVALTRGQLGI